MSAAPTPAYAAMLAQRSSTEPAQPCETPGGQGQRSGGTWATDLKSGGAARGASARWFPSKPGSGKHDGEKPKRRTRRTLLVLAILGTFLTPLLTATGASAHSNPAYSYDSSTGTTYPDWMAALPDTRRLSELSLPGTHDSGAAHFGGDTTETQSMDIDTQLNAGIRAFDIRLGNNEICPTSNGFYIFHGGICQFSKFKDHVMTPVYNFLLEHKGESVVMRIKPENGTDDDFASHVVEELATYDALMYKGGSSNPALLDMRGKIVVLQNFNGDASAATTFISYGDVDWQDNYSLGDNYDLADKWNDDIKAQFAKSDALPGNPGQIYGNFLSASGGGFPYFFASGHSSHETGALRLATVWTWDNVSGGSCKNSSQCIPEYPRLDCTAGPLKTCTVYFEGLNILAQNYINNSIKWRTGIVFADYPGAGLIKAIIDVNSRVVPDTTPPTVTVPAAMTVEATSAAGASVTFSATATDADPASPAVTCSPASASTFAIGTTTVTCSATDAAGNTSSQTFTVTVQDTTAPAISGTPGNQTAEATGAGGAVVTYTTPTANDLVDGSRTVTCAPASGTTFAIGATTVTCSASDTGGRSAPTTFTVTVQDTTDPVVNVPANVTREATGPTGATANYTASASDVVDGVTAATCAPASGSTFAIGTNTVTCFRIDAAGNTGTASFTVTVKGTSQQMTDLQAKVQTLPLDPPTQKNLQSILQNAQAAVARGDTRPACGMLSSFINQVQAQSGKKIATPTANDLIVDAQRIMAVLGCS